MTDFWEALHGNFIYFQNFFQKSAERHSPMKYMHTYIIGHNNPSVRIIDLVFHTTYVLHSYIWRDLQFKVDSEPQIFFEKLVMAILFTLRVFAKNLLRGNRRRNTFRILFWCLAWASNPGFSSNMPTHYFLDYGDNNIVLQRSLFF